MPMAERIERELSSAAHAYDETRDVIEAAEFDGKLVGAVIGTHEEMPTPGTRFVCIGVDAAYRGRGHAPPTTL